MKTTLRQRESWQQLHLALLDYLINYGEITIQQGEETITLNHNCVFEECGCINNDNYYNCQECGEPISLDNSVGVEDYLICEKCYQKYIDRYGYDNASEEVFKKSKNYPRNKRGS